MFTIKDVAEYYNSTQNHYKMWWDLQKNLSLHYGIWEEGVKNFSDSLVNTNKVLMEISNISESDFVLDAGCGVGGAAMFFSEEKNCNVIGITLSEKQIEFANYTAKNKKLDNKVTFKLMDYSNTSFDDESFDVILACESVSSACDKQAFVKEAFRLLKKGGRLIRSDYLIDKNRAKDKLLKKWGDTWSISNFDDCDNYVKNLKTEGFTEINVFDYTNKIEKSARRMYYASIFGAIPSEFYNLFHPKARRLAKTHYKSGYYQYKALKKGLWKYNIVLSIK